MRSFENGFLERHPVSHGIARSLRHLGELKGRQDLYKQQTPQILETLRQRAAIQSTESSNRIEQVTAPPERIRDLVARGSTPRNRPEQEIVGYRDVLATIHANHAGMEPTVGLVRQIHRDLYAYTATRGGEWKITDNQIIAREPDGAVVVRFQPVPAYATPESMQHLHTGFAHAWSEEEVDRTLIVAAYVLDFLCIHPFLDGNGRVARLLTLLLLYRAGFEVGRYISLERIVEGTKESYYDALVASSRGWHEGGHTLTPWFEYLLGVVTMAYREFEQRVGAVTTARGAKRQMVNDAIEHAVGDFTVADILEGCPMVSIDLIRRMLQEGRKEGRFECLGRGPRARWRRV